MRTKTILAAVAAAMAMSFASGAQAATDLPGSGDPFNLWFDEAGNGRVQDNGGPILADPGVNLGDGYLSYLLPEPVVTGDVSIADAGQPCTDASNCSDGLRFLLADNGNYYMQFYSSDGGALADTGFPTDFSFGFVGATENGDGTFAFLPGGGGNNQYFGISGGAVPEPATWAMMLLGVGMIGAGLRRRRSAVAIAA